MPTRSDIIDVRMTRSSCAPRYSGSTNTVRLVGGTGVLEEAVRYDAESLTQ